jgi:hypothetical protein
LDRNVKKTSPFKIILQVSLALFDEIQVNTALFIDGD